MDLLDDIILAQSIGFTDSTFVNYASDKYNLDKKVVQTEIDNYYNKMSGDLVREYQQKNRS